MLGRPQKTQQMFMTLKAMFPQIDLSIVNQQLSFSQNLQNIVSQLGTPKMSQTRQQITNMKQAVDQQELKIQKSLVNEEDVLGNITNRSMKRQKNQKMGHHRLIMDSIEEQHSQFWHNEQNIFTHQIKTAEYKHSDQMADIIEDIWQLGPENMKDWWKH